MSSQPPGPYGPPDRHEAGPRRPAGRPQRPQEITGYGSYEPGREYSAPQGYNDPDGYPEYDEGGYTYPQHPLTARRRPSWWLAAGLALVVVTMLALVSAFAVRTLVSQGREVASSSPRATTSAPPALPAAPAPGDASTSESGAAPETTAPTTESPSSAPSTPGEVALPAGDRVCSRGVGAAGSASCPFAKAVARAVRSDPSAGRYDVFSPVTKRQYDVTCQGGELLTCRGGSNATVHVIP